MGQYILTLLLLLMVLVPVYSLARKSLAKPGWIPQSTWECLILSLIVATVVQLPIVTTAPGWIVAAMLHGKGESMWIPMLVTNYIIYTTTFYLYFLSRRSEAGKTFASELSVDAEVTQ